MTVFVGNITERAPDAMVRHLLTTCGPVISWKRVQGATGKLQAFGFCEYNNPDAGLRAIRLLNEFTIADKKLVVKVDAKTKEVLKDYVTERISKNGDGTPLPEDDKLAEFTDEDIKYEDGLAKERIGQILSDHSQEIDSYVPKEPKELPVAREAPPASTLLQRMGTRDEGLDDLEEEKKGVVNREIEKFRETMKLREAEKEKDKEKDGERKSDRKSPARRRSRSREREGSREARDSRASSGRTSSTRDRPERAREERAVSRRSRSREPERRPRAVSRSRSRSPPRFERPRGSRDRDTRSQREVYKEREMEDEEKERKRAERKARDKEAVYQERLRAWEGREAKKGKEYEKERLKELKRTEEQEREARKLKEFLEDYDDERDDPKFYKGRELQRRVADREREAAKDAEDRKRELDEIEELKSAIYADPGQVDPAQEFQRRLQEREKEFLPDPRAVRAGSAAQSGPAPQPAPLRARSPATLEAEESPSPDRGPSPMDNYDNGSSPPGEEPTPEPEPTPPSAPATAQLHRTRVEPVKRKKLPVADIFNQDEDDEAEKPKKKMRPLPPPSDPTKKETKSSADDKRKHIKSLIEKIPTDKNDLFAYSIDWDLVDNNLMEKRIRPWVHKKIAEYIGEPEPTLTDFICSKVLAGSEPRAILEDVQMVLDEEAEVFVVKMWRLLIYEIENKKQKGTGVTK